MRNPVFDIMKGIGIVAVIIGHCSIHDDLFKFIFIWHMPLFFFISGYFFRPRCNMDMLNNNIKNLVVPYCFTCFVLLLLAVIRCFLVGNGNPISVFLGAVSGSGSTNNPRLFGGHMFIGAIWFLLALGWCRIIYNILFSRIKLQTKRNAIVVVLSLSASVLGRYLYVPTDFFQGVSALVFFLVGNMCKKYGWMNSYVKNYWLWFLISLPFVYIGMLMRPMGMVDNNYQLWPLNVIAALGGVSLVYIVSKVLNQYRLGGVLSRIGRISIIVLSLHLVEMNFDIVNSLCKFCQFSVDGNCFPLHQSFCNVINIILHIVMPIILALLLAKIRLIRKIYCLK